MYVIYIFCLTENTIIIKNVIGKQPGGAHGAVGQVCSYTLYICHSHDSRHEEYSNWMQ